MRRLVAGTGRTLITVGIMILAFVAYQLWGTGYFTARAQRELKDELVEFAATVAAAPANGTTTSSTTSTTSRSGTSDPTTRLPTTTTSTPENIPTINEGDPFATIRIPKIGVDYALVQGTARDDLKKGPGHYPTTVLPGQIGNAAIAGHRTTYGAPFNRLDELAPGDEIVVGYPPPILGTYVYRVFERPDGANPFVVLPSQVEVAEQGPAIDQKIAMLTLTTCHPKYSARERLVVQARLVVERSAPVVKRKQDLPFRVRQSDGTEAPVDGLTDDEGNEIGLEDPLAGDGEARGPAVQWAGGTALFGLGWWWFYRRFRHPALWFVGFVPFLVPLIAFYIYLERSLPAGY